MRNEDSQRVSVAELAAELPHAGEHALRRPEQADRQVEQMDSGRGHRSGRRFLGREAPVVGGQREELVLHEVGLDLQQRPQLARLRHAHQLLDRRLEALLVADGERDLVSIASFHRAQNIGARQRERLFAEHVLLRVRRPHDLIGMQGVRRAEHNALDLRVFQRVFELLGENNLFLICKGAGGGIWIYGPDNPQLRAALEQRDDDLAPPAEPAYGDAELLHLSPPWRSIRAPRVTSAASPPRRIRRTRPAPGWSPPRRRRSSAARPPRLSSWWIGSR